MNPKRRRSRSLGFIHEMNGVNAVRVNWISRMNAKQAFWMKCRNERSEWRPSFEFQKEMKMNFVSWSKAWRTERDEVLVSLGASLLKSFISFNSSIGPFSYYSHMKYSFSTVTIIKSSSSITIRNNIFFKTNINTSFNYRIVIFSWNEIQIKYSGTEINT